MKIAIAHDYLTQRGGAERVVLSMLKAFPEARLYTLLYEPSTTFEEFRDFNIVTSPINAIDALRLDHRAALPVLPFAAQRLRVDADVVLASTSGWAHGFDVGDANLVAYCYSPARWLYQHERYLGANPAKVRQAGLQVLRRPLIAWDKRAARRVDKYLAISTVVQQRIKQVYGRKSTIVPAPLSGSLSGGQSRPAALRFASADFYLCVSRLLPYKNVRQVMEGCRQAGVRLVIVGKGPEASALAAAAEGAAQVLSDLSDAEMTWLYANCRAVVAASYEDFGLTPLEGAAQGKPCVVLRWGGYLDTVVEGRTGVFFEQPSPDLIAEAIHKLADRRWSSEAIKSRADEFSESRFVHRIRQELVQP